MGLDVEPSVITDYKGVTVLAFHVGTATGSDGRRYNLETDMGRWRVHFIAGDGSRRRGLFALICWGPSEPGSGSQVHDFNGGTLPSGLFWAVELPGDAFRVSDDGRRRPWKPRTCVLDSFQFGGVPYGPGLGQLQDPVGGHRQARASRQGLAVPPTTGGVPGPFRHGTVHGDLLRVRGRLRLPGQGRHRRASAQLGPERKAFLT